VSRAPIEAFPYNDCSFDAVMSSMSFHRWANKPAALREVARLLRPGGVVALADLSDDDLVEHTRLRSLLVPFTSQLAPLADRHRWLELAGLRLLYVIPTLMERNVFMTVAERPSA
jgi:ubiquinone/menaquinone biosynthesis C-methylase UbiE